MIPQRYPFMFCARAKKFLWRPMKMPCMGGLHLLGTVIHGGAQTRKALSCSGSLSLRR